jgi:hypothetical protein
VSDLNKWLDSDNYAHLHINPTPNQSENGPLFTAQVNLYHNTNPDLKAICGYSLLKEEMYFKANRNSSSNHFSHDNLTGLYSLCITGQYYELLKKLPILKWNDRWWLHPRDPLFFLLCKRRFLCLSPFFALVLFLVSLHSFAQEKGRTSGKLLWHVRLRTLRKVYTSRISQAILRLWERIGLHIADQTWEEISRIYFVDKDHPLHKMIGK